MKHILLLCALWALATGLLAQQADNFEGKPAKGILYDKELNFDFRLHTNGTFAFAANYGRIKTYYRSDFYQIEIGALSHPREYRQRAEFPSAIFNTAARSFVFGKENHLYALRLGWGQKRYFSEKARERGVSVGMSYIIGPSVGILRPYYLDLYRFRDGGGAPIISPERYSEDNADLFLNITRIFGASSFARGWDELSFVPGGHAKLGLHLDWGAFDEFVKALDAGIMVDVYPQRMPIMLVEDNRAIFVNVYVALQFGKRW